MKLPKKQAAVVRAALEEWRASGLLDEETGKRLLDDLTPLPFDWYRLGRYASVSYTHLAGSEPGATGSEKNSGTSGCPP